MLHFYHVLKSELHGVNDMFSVLPYNISFKHGCDSMYYLVPVTEFSRIFFYI